MKEITGDLIQLALNGKFDVIVHGCNTFCTMGAGIAKAIKQNFPEAYRVDQETEKGNRAKLGTITYAKIDKPGHSLIVVNAYTQHEYWGAGVKADYVAVENCFRQIKQLFAGKIIGYPKIGAGLARGDWDKISKIIDQELDGEDHALVKWSAGR